MNYKVQHFVSVAPEEVVITRARVVSGGRTDDVSFFIGDNICGTICIAAGTGQAVCEQLQLVDREMVSFAVIQREFKRMLSATQEG